jgi:hypothetical protein
MGDFTKILNFNWLFLKLNRFISKLAVSSSHALLECLVHLHLSAVQNLGMLANSGWSSGRPSDTATNGKWTLIRYTYTLEINHVLLHTQHTWLLIKCVFLSFNICMVENITNC